ncbi:transmembrane protein 45B-like [Athalia rosae]|uniref:transmembrane protein 45B-like n=1 Tax=Athalia rosae TaxID=37344 RepID=UPI0020342395|nr:transmembrane protein 45B-like [Athalia rosae]
MEESDSALGYILSGMIFYIFGLKWCYEYAKFWPRHPRDQDSEREVSKLLQFSKWCQGFLRRHPLEGTLKLLATALGLASALTRNLSNITTVSPKVVHATTICLFFALSGLVDVLTFYFPNVVGNGLGNMALAQSFFVEGLLFFWATPFNGVIIILAGIVWTTSLTIVLELVWPDMKLLRAASTLLHGGWLAHMVRSYHITDIESSGRIALIFSWHLAAAFVVTLCIVSITRSCAPKVRPTEPPEIPIYDYCHLMDHHRV